jgi:Protein of unknown function (DUF3710)
VFRRRRRAEVDRRGGPGQADAQDQAWLEDEEDDFNDEAELDEEAELDDDTGLDKKAGLEDEPQFEDSAEFDDEGNDDSGDGAAQAGAGHLGELGSGPWDGARSYPDTERMDFGSLLVPPREGLDIQINMAEDQGVWIAIVRGDSALQLQAFAAPKTSGLWDEVRQEIAEEVAKSGGQSRETQGPFGPELHARINPVGAGKARQPLQPVRFLGVDGPRWFLRGLISGPAAQRPELARPFEELFADVVVVRGDHPAPPRDLLEIRLPEDAQRALEEQLAQAGQNQQYPNPFERGPEITETR